MCCLQESKRECDFPNKRVTGSFSVTFYTWETAKHQRKRLKAF